MFLPFTDIWKTTILSHFGINWDHKTFTLQGLQIHTCRRASQRSEGSASSRTTGTDDLPECQGWWSRWDHALPSQAGYASAQSVSGAPADEALPGQPEISVKYPEEPSDSRRSQSLQPGQKLQQWHPWMPLEVYLSRVQAPAWWNPTSGRGWGWGRCRGDSTLIWESSERECLILGVTRWLLLPSIDWISQSLLHILSSLCHLCFSFP